MNKKIDNNFLITYGVKSINFYTREFRVTLKYENIFDKNIQTLGFFLANVLAYNHNENMNDYSRVFNINRVDDIYTIESESDLELAILFPNQEIKGKGTIFKLENGIEIFYKETSKKMSKIYHYQFITEQLDNDEKLLEVIDCQKREMVECYLVDDSFKIDSFNTRELSGKGFKPLFKVR